MQGEAALGLPRFEVEKLRRFATTILETVGCPQDEASLVAVCTVEGDVRGVASHGLMRLPLYVDAIEAGGIVGGAEMSWVHERGATGTLDAAFGFGHTAMSMAADRAEELALRHGCAVVGVRRSTHFGMAALWVERLTERGMVAMVLSTTAPTVAPFGSAEALLGTNPLAIGIPINGREPIVLDMATSAGSYGRIVLSAAEGEPIPEGWALDSNGRPTTDASEALAGVLLPFGAHKGSGLATAIEFLAGAMPGAHLSHQITDIYVDAASRMGTGHLILAIEPTMLAGPGLFDTRASEFVALIESALPAAGHRTVRLPGDVEREHAKRALDLGVPVATSTIEALDVLARRLGKPGLESTK